MLPSDVQATQQAKFSSPSFISPLKARRVRISQDQSLNISPIVETSPYLGLSNTSVHYIEHPIYLSPILEQNTISRYLVIINRFLTAVPRYDSQPEKENETTLVDKEKVIFDLNQTRTKQSFVPTDQRTFGSPLTNFQLALPISSTVPTKECIKNSVPSISLLKNNSSVAPKIQTKKNICNSNSLAQELAWATAYVSGSSSNLVDFKDISFEPKTTLASKGKHQVHSKQFPRKTTKIHINFCPAPIPKVSTIDRNNFLQLTIMLTSP